MNMLKCFSISDFIVFLVCTYAQALYWGTNFEQKETRVFEEVCEKFPIYFQALVQVDPTPALFYANRSSIGYDYRVHYLKLQFRGKITEQEGQEIISIPLHERRTGKKSKHLVAYVGLFPPGLYSSDKLKTLVAEAYQTFQSTKAVSIDLDFPKSYCQMNYDGVARYGSIEHCFDESWSAVDLLGHQCPCQGVLTRRLDQPYCFFIVNNINGQILLSASYFNIPLPIGLMCPTNVAERNQLMQKIFKTIPN